MAKLTTIDDLKSDPENANLGTERGREILDASLATVGAGRAPVADREGIVLAGNKTVDRWRAAGGKVRFVETDGSELVVVVRKDLDLRRNPKKARELAYYDNRSSEVGLAWDPARLVDDARAGVVDLSAFWKPSELEEVIARLQAETAAAGNLADAEALPPEPTKTKVKLGEVYALGRHRVMCGDGSNAAHLATLLGDVQVHAIETDPPYGTASNSKVQKRGARIETFDIEWDNAAPLDWIAPGVARLAAGGAVVSFWENAGVTTLWRALAANGVRPLHTVYWEKPVVPQPRPNFCSCIETAVFGRKTGGKVVAWNGGGTTANVIAAPRAAGHDRTPHETQKSLLVWETLLRLITNTGQNVLDSYLGAGTTVVAAERADRNAFGMELRPISVQWTLDRWARLSGQKAELVGRVTRETKRVGHGKSERARNGRQTSGPSRVAAGHSKRA
jgi:DNA modification methylase